MLVANVEIYHRKEEATRLLRSGRGFSRVVVSSCIYIYKTIYRVKRFKHFMYMYNPCP